MKLRKSWAAHFLAFERALGVGVAIALIAWAELLGGRAHLDRFLADHGETLYIVVAPIGAAMLGFILAAAAIVVTAAPAERLTLLRQSAHYDDLWKCFRSAMRFLGLATLAAIVGLIVWGAIPTRIVFFFAVLFGVLAILRVARCVWAMNWVVRIFTAPSVAYTPTPS